MIGGLLYLDPQRAVRAALLDRVVDQIEKELSHLPWIGEHGRKRSKVKLPPYLYEPWRERLSELVDHATERYRCAIPAWPHSRSWGYAPSGALGLALFVVLLLALLERA